MPLKIIFSLLALAVPAFLYKSRDKSHDDIINQAVQEGLKRQGNSHNVIHQDNIGDVIKGGDDLDPFIDFVEHLKSREGFSPVAYLDSVGKETIGYGHLITKADYKRYGTDTTKWNLSQLLAVDSRKAWNESVNYVTKHNLNSDLTVPLASVFYQLGGAWFEIHTKTHAAIIKGDYKAAVREIKSSLWNTQTPVRVADFADALNKAAVA